MIHLHDSAFVIQLSRVLEKVTGAVPDYTPMPVNASNADSVGSVNVSRSGEDRRDLLLLVGSKIGQYLKVDRTDFIVRVDTVLEHVKSEAEFKAYTGLGFDGMWPVSNAHSLNGLLPMFHDYEGAAQYLRTARGWPMDLAINMAQYAMPIKSVSPTERTFALSGETSVLHTKAMEAFGSNYERLLKAIDPTDADKAERLKRAATGPSLSWVSGVNGFDFGIPFTWHPLCVQHCSRVTAITLRAFKPHATEAEDATYKHRALVYIPHKFADHFVLGGQMGKPLYVVEGPLKAQIANFYTDCPVVAVRDLHSMRMAAKGAGMEMLVAYAKSYGATSICFVADNFKHKADRALFANSVDDHALAAMLKGTDITSVSMTECVNSAGIDEMLISSVELGLGKTIEDCVKVLRIYGEKVVIGPVAHSGLAVIEQIDAYNTPDDFLYVQDMSATGTGKSHNSFLEALQRKDTTIYVVEQLAVIPASAVAMLIEKSDDVAFYRGVSNEDLLAVERDSGVMVVKESQLDPMDKVLGTVSARNCTVVRQSMGHRHSKSCKCAYNQTRKELKAGAALPKVIITTNAYLETLLRDLEIGGQTQNRLHAIFDDVNLTKSTEALTSTEARRLISGLILKRRADETTVIEGIGDERRMRQGKFDLLVWLHQVLEDLPTHIDLNVISEKIKLMHVSPVLEHLTATAELESELLKGVDYMSADFATNISQRVKKAMFQAYSTGNRFKSQSSASSYLEGVADLQNTISDFFMMRVHSSWASALVGKHAEITAQLISQIEELFARLPAMPNASGVWRDYKAKANLVRCINLLFNPEFEKLGRIYPKGSVSSDMQRVYAVRQDVVTVDSETDMLDAQQEVDAAVTPFLISAAATGTLDEKVQRVTHKTIKIRELDFEMVVAQTTGSELRKHFKTITHLSATDDESVYAILGKTPDVVIKRPSKIKSTEKPTAYYAPWLEENAFDLRESVQRANWSANKDEAISRFVEAKSMLAVYAANGQSFKGVEKVSGRLYLNQECIGQRSLGNSKSTKKLFADEVGSNADFMSNVNTIILGQQKDANYGAATITNGRNEALAYGYDLEAKLPVVDNGENLAGRRAQAEQAWGRLRFNQRTDQTWFFATDAIYNPIDPFKFTSVALDNPFPFKIHVKGEMNGLVVNLPAGNVDKEKGKVRAGDEMNTLQLLSVALRIIDRGFQRMSSANALSVVSRRFFDRFCKEWEVPYSHNIAGYGYDAKQIAIAALAQLFYLGSGKGNLFTYDSFLNLYSDAESFQDVINVLSFIQSNEAACQYMAQLMAGWADETMMTDVYSAIGSWFWVSTNRAEIAPTLEIVKAEVRETPTTPVTDLLPSDKHEAADVVWELVGGSPEPLKGRIGTMDGQVRIHEDLSRTLKPGEMMHFSTPRDKATSRIEDGFRTPPPVHRPTKGYQAPRGWKITEELTEIHIGKGVVPVKGHLEKPPE